MYRRFVYIIISFLININVSVLVFRSLHNNLL